MKTLKKLMALVIAMVMVMAVALPVFADESSQHTITITNTDQNVSHTYEGYQIFKGKLDAEQQILSDIVWGNGVDGNALLAALKSSNDASLKATASNVTAGTGDNVGKYFDANGKEINIGDNLFKNCSTPAEVAKVFGTFQSTNGETSQSGAIDAVAKIIGETTGVLKATNKITFTETNKEYSATVTGDGYYFVKDVTTTLTNNTTHGSDTLSKYLLAVVKDTTVVAKDTHLMPDKEILQNGTNTVKEGTAAVGDTVTFQVKIKVPDTRKYVDHFIFDMKDKLPVGMTFMGITSVKVGEANVPYTLKVAPATATPPTADDYGEYTAPADAAAAVTTTGGQQIKLIFREFKAFAEGEEGRIGADMVVTYTAVVNDDADFTPTGNKNEVVFDYSNDPNHDYDGDEPGPNEPMGVTPKDETITKLINIEIQKTGNGGTVAALAGAEFEIESDDYNVTLVTGEKFVTGEYTPAAGEEIKEGTYYKLKDGSYTTTVPTQTTGSSYDSTETTYKKVTFSKSNTTPGETKKVTVISGEDGKIKLEGLRPGTYTIKETHAPSGYNLDPTTYTIKVKWTYDSTNKTGTFEKDASSSEGVAWDGTNAKATITIDNKGGTQLPSTGGIGTTLFYIIGAILVLGAGILLVTRRRMNAR